MIRRATIDDFEEVCDLLRYAYKDWDISERNGGLPVSEATGAAWIREMISEPTNAVFVIDDDGLQGLVVGGVIPSWWYFGWAAMQYMIYIKPDHRGNGRKLVLAFEEWAKSFPRVKQIIAGIENDRAGVLYKRAGYEPRITNYVKEV